ncbi:unnamed protein product, partial [Rotaria magnacalcarata]
MNGAVLMVQANQFLGNNIINPQQQQRWMDKPIGDSSEFAYLRSLDSLLAKQIMLGFASQAKYGIFNNQGEQVYYAFE